MNKKQLLDIIEDGETQEVELKESFHSSQDFSKLMSGFANTHGGIIIVGVTSKKKVVGVKEDTDKLRQKISASAQTISPPLVPDVLVRKVNGLKIVAIVIQRAIDNAAHSFKGVYYVRVGSTLRRLEGNQIADFLRSRQVLLCFDETFSDAVSEDMSTEKVRGYLKIRNQEDFLIHNSLEKFFLSLRLATKNGTLKIKNAAALFFAKEPEKLFPQVEINLVQFDGAEPVKIISHKLLQSDPVSSIEKAISFVKTNISKSIQITDKPRRQEKFEYPLEVIRESIINAVAHRDYFSRDSIQINLFSDRIEVTSPGSLPTGLSRKLFKTRSVRRNPLIYILLRDYGYIEGLGSGIPRMINAMRNQGLKDPEFEIDELFFRLVLFNEKGTRKPIEEYANLNKRQRRCIEFLKEHKSIKTKKYEELNKVSYATALADINELIKFKYVKKIGSYREAYYVIN